MPLANSYLTNDQLSVQEPSYPLHAQVCNNCGLVQVVHEVTPQQIFNHYSYFSSYSPSWLEHAQKFAVNAINRFNLNESSKVVEIASNDGYLLQYFVEASIPCIGVEPAINVAEVAIKGGVPTIVAYFGVATANNLVSEGWAANLVISNNVLAHVPDINDFIKGISLVLQSDGVWSVEFPHLLNMLKYNQFDTIYHEHYSYLSLLAVQNICSIHGLNVFDLEEIPTHGGSLRLFVGKDDVYKSKSAAVLKVEQEERSASLDKPEGYLGFTDKVNKVKEELLSFIRQAKRDGKVIAAYGAAAKGNTLMNFCGIKAQDIAYVVDDNPHKQNTFLPGSHIPVYSSKFILDSKPDYILILPWNIAGPISEKISFIRDWGGKFVTAVPDLKVF